MSSQKKILMILPSDQPGGAEQLQFSLAKEFLEQGADVQLIFLKASTITKSLSNQTLYLNARNLAVGMWRLIWHSFHEKYDLVFCSQTLLNALVGILVKIKRLNTTHLIFRESTSVFARFKGLKLLIYKAAYRFGYNSAHLVICQTQEMKNILLRNRSFLRNGNVQVIPNPIDLKVIQMQSNGEVIEHTTDQPFFVAAGRLIDVKGFDRLINAFAYWVLEHPLHRLLILGDGPLLESLKQLSRDLHLESSVIFMGHVSNPIPYFKKALVCVMSSIREGFPNVLLQMMSQNGRVVSTLCAGDIDCIPGIMICEPGNVKALFEAMKLAALLNNHQASEKLTMHLDFLAPRTYSNYISSIFTFLSA
jgi:glycosyltransferase involved in cell wall biosynthesis